MNDNERLLQQMQEQDVPDADNALIGAVWASLDANGGDENATRDICEQAIDTWAP